MAPRQRPTASPKKASRACPICGKPQEDGFAPFCSKRCADVDLHRWLGGAYVLPGEPAGTADETDEEA